jgi:hypothetical protein
MGVDFDLAVKKPPRNSRLAGPLPKRACPVTGRLSLEVVRPSGQSRFLVPAGDRLLSAGSIKADWCAHAALRCVS